ncbi:flagellar protein FlaG [Sporolactobacillus vineae]|uniref:flagellar protein FlaG n=1 Tax=Sporolactobacillus vineae TaxID=444463 RepID=UPI000287D952|nr:flagellar protein FlaG [Sporolactobacillus vineae]
MDVSIDTENLVQSSMQQNEPLSSVSEILLVDGQQQSQSELTQSKSPTNKQVEQLVNEANNVLQPETTQLKYVYFDKLKTYYVQLQDVNIHQVIREIPPKKFMEMYAAIAEKLGLILNEHA